MPRRPEDPVGIRAATIQSNVIRTVRARWAADVGQGVGGGVAVGVVGAALGFAAAEGVTRAGVGLREGPAAVEGVFTRTEGVEVHGWAGDGDSIRFGGGAGGGEREQGQKGEEGAG